LLDPTLKNRVKIEEKLLKAIRSVATKNEYKSYWANDKVGMFAVGDTAQPLFETSVAQDVMLWEGNNLVVYAVEWEWSLARKLKRVGSEKRPTDISDAAALLRN
jgi:hypothetical protein